MTNRCFSYLLTDFFLRTTFQAVKPEDTVSHNNLKQNYTLTPRGGEGERERGRERDGDREPERYRDRDTKIQRDRDRDREKESDR